VLTTLLFVALRSMQTPPANPQVEISSLLDSYEPKHFNGFLYVEQGGKQLFYHSVGYARRETKQRFDFNTGIEIGSIVKPISKIVLTKLCAAGKLSLDDSISKFFPSVPEEKKSITVRLLAEHRSGFQDVFGGDYEPMKKDQLMRDMLASKLLFQPGTDNRYSNSGYSMLAAIIEKVTGKSFEQAIGELEFAPLGLKRTGYTLPHWHSSQVACGYKMDGTSWGTPLDHFWFKDGPGWNLRGNGGMITTIPEIARWARAAHDGELMSPEYYKFFTPGLASDKVKPNSIWSAAGGNGIFDTVVAYNPSRRLIVVAFSSDARFQIESVLLKELAKPIFRLTDG